MTTLLALVTFALCSPGTIASGAQTIPDEPALLVSADTRGAITSCSSCPRTAADGPGLPQRAGWTAALRARRQDVVLVDAGDFLIGPESLPSSGAVIVEAYDAMGYEAAHVTTADLWLGRDATLAVLAEARFELFSANLYGAGGQRLFLPFHLTEVGAESVALVGVSAPGSAPVGVTVRPVAESLSEVARELESFAVDQRVLFFHGSSQDLDAVPAELLAGFDAVVTSRAAIDCPPFVRLPLHGAAMALLQFTSEGVLSEVTGMPADAPTDPRVAEIVATHISPSVLWTEAVESNDAASTFDPSRSGTQELWRSDKNRAMELVVVSAKRSTSIRGIPAPAGRTWLTLETEWENQLARELVRELGYSRAVHLKSLARQVFLIVDDAIVVRPEVRRADELGAHGGSLFLPERGEFIAARLVFAVPQTVPVSLELCAYPDQFGPLHVSLLESAPGVGVGVAGGDPVARGSNAELEVEVRAFGRVAEWAGQPAREGRELWAVDLAATSRITLGVDALALDPDAEADARAQIGEVFEYLHGYELAALVLDGAFHCAPLATSWIDREPLFLPDRRAGGRLVFEVPLGARPTALWLPFTGLKFDGEDETRYPRSLSLALSDAEPAETKSLLAFENRPIGAELLEASRAKTHLRLRLSLTNEGPSAGFIEPRKRFELRLGTARPLVPDERWTAAALYPAPDRIWLERGHRYAFDLVFDLPHDASHGSLVFKGVTREVALPLRWEQTAVTVGEPSPSSPAVVGRARGPEEAKAPATDRPVHDSDRVPQGLAGVGLTGSEVNSAIERGASHLWAFIVEEELKGSLKNFGRTQEHWLAALALVHADYHERNPTFAATLKSSLKNVEKWLSSTYGNAVICMLIDALGDESLRPVLMNATRHLIEGQGSDGSWSYECSLPNAGAPDEPPPPSFVTVSQPGGEDLTRVGPWSEKELNGDNSVAQFALLGLRVAQRWGFDVPKDCWARSRALFERRQEQDGGWAYRKGNAYGSMTCAGICSLAISRWAQGETFDAQVPQIRAAVDWLDEHFTVETNPKATRFHYYYIYSLERVGQLLGAEFLGKYEWYPLGARFLIDAQQPDGAWKEERKILKATSFALLFLTRATEGLSESIQTPLTGRLVTSIEASEASSIYFILDASGSMHSKLDGRSKLDVARDALVEISRELPEGTPVALRVYGHRKAAIEPGADEDTELVLPFEPWSEAYAERFMATLARLRPRGKTPLAASLDAALTDLHGQRSTVVLLTDGGEQTRARRDPIAAARPFGQNADLSLVVIGLDIGKERWTTQLAGMAAAASGPYLPVDASAQLAGVLRSALLALPDQVELLDAAGAVRARYGLPDERELDPGNYQLAFKVGPHSFLVPIRIEAGGATRVHLDPGHFQPQGD